MANLLAADNNYVRLFLQYMANDSYTVRRLPGLEWAYLQLSDTLIKKVMNEHFLGLMLLR